MKSLEISGKLLARNMLLNLIGQGLPLLVGMISIPFIIRGLGTEKFGLLSLAWVIIGYFTVFDLGLGRATTKFVAEALGNDKEEEISNIVWTAVAVQAMFGVLGGMVLSALTPLLVGHVLNIPSGLTGEAKTMFYLLAFSVPVVLISSSFRGVLEAFQRFDLVNAVKIPASSATFLLPLIGLFLKFGLSGIVLLMLLARLGALVVFVVLSLRLEPRLRRIHSSFNLFPRLFSFGGWVMVSSIVSPILQYFDRFFIGSLLTMSAVAYYATPIDVIGRLWIIPGSLVMTLFPAYSTLGTINKEQLQVIHLRATKYITVVMGIIALILILFSNEILRVWLGADFAKHSTLPLQIVSFGMLCGSISQLCFAYFQGVGRPDIGAKICLLLLPISLAFTWILISKIGIVGAALSWTFSRALGMLLSFGVVWNMLELDFTILSRNGLLRQSVWLVVIAVLLLPLLWVNNILYKVCITIFVCSIFFITQIYYIMDTEDKNMVMAVINQLLQNIGIRPTNTQVENRKR